MKAPKAAKPTRPTLEEIKAVEVMPLDDLPQVWWRYNVATLVDWYRTVDKADDKLLLAITAMENGRISEATTAFGEVTRLLASLRVSLDGMARHGVQSRMHVERDRATGRTALRRKLLATVVVAVPLTLGIIFAPKAMWFILLGAVACWVLFGVIAFLGWLVGLYLKRD